MYWIGKPFRKAGHLFIQGGNLDTTKSRTDKKQCLAGFLDRQDGYMYGSSSFGRYMYNQFSGCSNTNKYMDSIATASTTTTTTSTTTMMDNNYIRAKGGVSLFSTSLSEAQETLLEVLISQWCLSNHPKMSTLQLWKRLASKSLPRRQLK